MVSDMHNLLEKAYQTNDFTKVEIMYLLENITLADREGLYNYALKTKQAYYGDKVYLRGLIEFSNICRQDCLYCGIRASNAKVERYRLTPEEILVCCDQGYELGYRTFVLQSGEEPYSGHDGTWHSASARQGACLESGRQCRYADNYSNISKKTIRTLRKQDLWG